MSTVVAVAGGSSGLGRTIAEELKNSGRYEVVIFSRKENPKLEEEIGIPVLAADYSSAEALLSLLETNKVAILISTANSFVDPTPEFNLIEAASRSNVTRRFIPNAWSALKFKDEPRFQQFPVSASKLKAYEALRKSGLEWTAIYPGFFMEITVEGLPSHLTVYPVMIDVKNNAAALPNKGEALITLTHSRDIAKYTVSLLGLEKWEEAYYIAGDVKSWNQIVAAAEAHKGVKFNVSYDPIEKMQKGQVTELPGHTLTYELFGGRENALPVVQGLFAQYGLLMDEGGMFTYHGGTFLNDLFPDIKPLTLEEAWKVAGKKN